MEFQVKISCGANNFKIVIAVNYVVYLNIMKKVNGFTLIELLVVISIMSILTIITVSQFTTARQKARDVSRKSDLNSVSKAVTMYFADYGLFPAETAINTNWAGEFSDDGYIYMKTLPKENQVGKPPYCYVVSTDGKSFALFSVLENTMDSDYKGPYTHCGGNQYHYSTVSQNAVVSDFTSLNQ